MRVFYLICLLHLSGLSRGQNVQWASRVIEFSAEASSVQFSSNQILGAPDVLPKTEMSANAWSPGSSKREHFISVAFNQPMAIKQTAVAEAFNAGALKEVYAIDEKGDEILLITLSPSKIDLPGRMFNFFMEETDYTVTGLKLVFDGKMYQGRFFIDAVAISDSEIPIRPQVETISNVRSDIEVKPLTTNVNSPADELRPLLSPDGKTLFFSRTNSQENTGGKDDPEDIWLSAWLEEQGEWAPAQNIGQPLNNANKNFINALSANGNSTLMVLGSEANRKNSNLSVSMYTNGQFTSPVDLPFSSELGLKDFDFTLSYDRRVIIFAALKADTYGAKDLYASFLLPSGTWSEPLNLGPLVNSVSDELSPFLSTDNRTLYFSSEGYSGYGGTDIYSSTRLDNSWQNWSGPRNLGPEINTSFDEKHFTIPLNSEYAYMSRFNKDGNADVYSIKLPLFEAVSAPSPVETPTITFENINFGSNKAMLLSESFDQLDDVIAFMNENLSTDIVISSHTDNVGNEDDNLMLSKQRAEAIFDYLTETGKILGTRIKIEWFGESMPLDTNETPKDVRETEE